jgi:hypothetical protein
MLVGHAHQDRDRTRNKIFNRECHKDPLVVNWLGHEVGSGAAQLDELLLDGAGMQSMIENTNRKTVGSIRTHLRHLSKEHGLPIVRDESGRYMFDRIRLAILRKVP